jgi:glucose/arabinose dehydrogenase
MPTRSRDVFAYGALLLAAACALGPPAEWPEERPLTVRDGFVVEQVYGVPRAEQGSWVSLAVLPDGALVASDEQGALYRIELPAIEPVGGVAPVARVEALPFGGHAQGLLHAFDALYFVRNEGLGLLGSSGANGLYRVPDGAGEPELLRRLEGAGEHGPHQLVVSPDGKSLYLIAGNTTRPTEFASSQVAAPWREDALLPVIPNMMILNVPPPGGWIARLNPDGRRFELFANGFRNPYDLAFNRAGDLFTYDADMEWDIGAPWYRPTRVVHVRSGGEFGWRRGSGKWPDWYPDSLGSVVDVGTGSPTGVLFGYGAAFPERYEEALFLLDWSHGRIYAAQLEPAGSSYTATLEPFLAGQPLPVTDAVVNPVDRAMYFSTGGRQAVSAIYRVRYVGDEPIAPAGTAPAPPPNELHVLRRALETLHTPEAPDGLERAWPPWNSSARSIQAK